MEKKTDNKQDLTKANGEVALKTESQIKAETVVPAGTGVEIPEENGVMISTREAQEYCEYKRRKKRAEITSAIFRSETPLLQKGEVKVVCDTAAKHRQAAVRLTPVILEAEGGFFRERGVRTDCLIGGTGETLPKVKAYEARRALWLKANELSVAITPSFVEGGDYAGIRKELRKLRRVAGKAVLKARLEKRYSPERMSRIAKLCVETGVDYFSVPRYEGCESLRADLTGACKLEVSGVETLTEYKRLTDAGVERIVTERIREIYLEWMREVDKITFPEKKLSSPMPTAREKPELPKLPVGQKLLPKPEENKTETKKNPETDYQCRLEGSELKFL